MKTIGLLGDTGWSSTIGYYKALNELVAEHLLAQNQKSVLLLATTFTMEDGFFAQILEKKGISVTIPTKEERDQMRKIHDELMHNIVTESSRDYFANLIKRHQNLDAVVLGCTEYPMLVDETNSILPVIDPVKLQTKAAVNFSLA